MSTNIGPFDASKGNPSQGNLQTMANEALKLARRIGEKELKGQEATPEENGKLEGLLNRRDVRDAIRDMGGEIDPIANTVVQRSNNQVTNEALKLARRIGEKELKGQEATPEENSKLEGLLNRKDVRDAIRDMGGEIDPIANAVIQRFNKQHVKGENSSKSNLY